MDAKNKKERFKMKSTQKFNDEASSLLVVDDDQTKSNIDNNIVSERLNTLQNRLHIATSQLGGKGTIRRRRLRKTQSLTSDHNESKLAFINKFDLHDYGQMERITFINQKGEINSYDSVRLNANFKTGIYYLNFSQYKIAKKRRSKTQIMNESQKDTQQQQEEQQVQKGIRHQKAEEVLKNLEFINKKEDSLLNELSDLNQRDSVLDALNKIKLEINSLIGSDAYEYLRNLTSKKSPTPQPLLNFNKKSLFKVSSIENLQDNNESKRISCEKEIDLIINQRPSIDYYDDDYIPDVDIFDEPSSSLQMLTQSNRHSELISTTSDLVNLDLDQKYNQTSTTSNHPSSEFFNNSLNINNKIEQSKSNDNNEKDSIKNSIELNEMVVITKPVNSENIVRQINIIGSMNQNYHGHLEAQNTLSDISNYGEFEDSMDDDNNNSNNQSLNKFEENLSNVNNKISETSNSIEIENDNLELLHKHQLPIKKRSTKKKLKSRKSTTATGASVKSKESDSSFDDPSLESLTSLSSLSNSNSNNINLDESNETEIKPYKPVNYSKLSEEESNEGNFEIINIKDNSENQQKQSEDSIELKDLRSFAFLHVKSNKKTKKKKKLSSKQLQEQANLVNNDLKSIKENKIEPTLIHEDNVSLAIKQNKPNKNTSKSIKIDNKKVKNETKSSQIDNLNDTVIDEKRILEVINAKRKEAAASKHKSKNYLVNKKEINNNYKKRSKVNKKESTTTTIKNIQTSILNNDKKILTEEITILKRERSIDENDDNLNDSCVKLAKENFDKINIDEQKNPIKSSSNSNIDNKILFNQLFKDEKSENISNKIDELKQKQESDIYNELNGNY
jgi:hypothetical protein